ncbi:hypothetical protein ACU686_02850 [Yinghuangia aomiensis]
MHATTNGAINALTARARAAYRSEDVRSRCRRRAVRSLPRARSTRPAVDASRRDRQAARAAAARDLTRPAPAVFAAPVPDFGAVRLAARASAVDRRAAVRA